MFGKFISNSLDIFLACRLLIFPLVFNSKFCSYIFLFLPSEIRKRAMIKIPDRNTYHTKKKYCHEIISGKNVNPMYVYQIKHRFATFVLFSWSSNSICTTFIEYKWAQNLNWIIVCRMSIYLIRCSRFWFRACRYRYLSQLGFKIYSFHESLVNNDNT